jgi:hypothetical protein
MSLSVLEAKSELSAMLHGTTLSQVENINGIFNRAARQLLLDIDPQEMKRIAALATSVYPIIYDYPSPDDLKGNKIIDIYPQIGREPGQRLSQTYNQNFDIYKSMLKPGEFTIISDKGTKSLRISYWNNTSGILLNNAGTLTENGTWVAAGTASNLVQNLVTNINGSHSIQFDVAVGTGTITNSTMTALDLSSYLNQAAFLFKVYLGTASSLTSISFRIGSDASNYYQSSTLTTGFQGNAFVNTWNDVGQAWSTMTTVGSPDASAINYIQVSFVAGSSMTGIQLAQFWSSLGVPMNIEYYSKFLFSNVTSGAWQEKVLDDSDLINLDTESYNLFLYQAAFLCVQQALGQDAGYDTNIFLDKYNQGLIRYKRMYKSEITKPQQMYYKKTFKGYNSEMGTTLSHSQ